MTVNTDNVTTDLDYKWTQIFKLSIQRILEKLHHGLHKNLKQQQLFPS